ncbi:wall-associated receptor kinase 2-like [Euphorbia lathyris]|uniref:wall-associated receptor kinase 2-like n=1 Tax=Euphorbia lathyris TaxID=212925 RepID=UPI003313EC2B
MLALWIFMLFTAATSQDVVTSSDDCPRMCGNVHVPYPFGINHTSATSAVNPSCAMNSSFFFFICNSSFSPPRLFFARNMPIHNISVEEGTISVRVDSSSRCYNTTGLVSSFGQSIRLGNGPFTFSDSRNKLIAIGCDTLALMQDTQKTFGSGCISLCNRNVTLEGSCSGFGCCQTSVPQNLKTLTISLASPTNHSNVLQFNPCEYAFIADQRTFNVSDLQLSTQPFSRITQEFVKSDVVIEWVAREETCEEAQSNSNSVCGSNTNCSYSENGNGYRCVCKDGFTGNPYLPQGCQDIDECKEANKYPCQGSCKNIIGSYTCKCPIGMRGDGKSGCQGFRVTAIAAVVGAVLFTMIIAMLILIMYKRRRKETNFFRNGGMLLKHQRVRIFTEAELVKATKNYDESQLLGEGGFGYVYKGILADGTQIAVKKAKDISKAQINQEYQQEIGIVSQVNHKNVVKILGLCLETKVPLLVYEFISNGTLFQHIHHKKPQALANWKNRLRVAEETALALNYLHSLADPPIIHGDVKTSNILLDDTYTAKVSDFGASVLISPGDSDMASKIKGTFGYLDPEYLMTGCLTEKSDVYSFGVVLVELLTGEKPNFMARSGEKSNVIQYFISSIESHDLDQLVCFGVANEDEMEEIEAFAEIAKQCLCSSGAKRPTMKEVADEFGRLRKLNERSRWNHDKKSEEETEHLLGESSYDSIHVENLNQHDIYSLEMDLYPAYSI